MTRIIIVTNMDIVLETCDLFGDPKIYVDGSQGQSPVIASSPSYGSSCLPGSIRGEASQPNRVVNPVPSYLKSDLDTNHTTTRSSIHSPQSFSNSQMNQNTGMARGSHPPTSTYGHPSTYRPSGSTPQPPISYTNKGSIARNDAPMNIIPISHLNPYQGRWTIKSRVTTKSELRRYNSPRGEGKVFSFDLLDSDKGEIRVTCFNAVADQFYSQITPGTIYYISKGNLKPAQKNFNHLKNDFEIHLESTSTIQPCFDDKSIPNVNFDFRSIDAIESIEINSIIDIIGVVTSISGASPILKKNGTETHKRTLTLNDMSGLSGRNVEVTLWGNFCTSEGTQLQSMLDSGLKPILAIKSARVGDFGGKCIGTISSSQLCIDYDGKEAHELKNWFDKEGGNMISKPISKDMSSLVGKIDVRKTISQIKDESLGRSEKPDWITIIAMISFIKTDPFCYTACPLMFGDRQCSKKVNNNGDGNWHCDRCDQSFPECDYRYIFQFQIQDHTGLTWVSTFQEAGEQIVGVSAKELYLLKHEHADDVKFAGIIRGILFNKYSFKLKIKEETYNDETRLKLTVIKAEMLNPSSECKYLLSVIDGNNTQLGKDDPTVIPGRLGGGGYSNAQTTYGVKNNLSDNIGNVSRALQGGDYGASYGMVNHTVQGASGGGSVNRSSVTVGTSINCYKCQQPGHWARDCPGSGPESFNPMGGGDPTNCYKCQKPGHWAANCPDTGAASFNARRGGGSSYTGSPYTGNVERNNASGGASGNCYKCQQSGHWAKDCPSSIQKW